MKERLKKILTGLGIIALSVAGLWEYIQLFMYYDVPQPVIIMPLIGMLTAVFIRKIWFVVPICTALICIVYQMVDEGKNFEGIVTISKFNIILNILPVIIILMLVGIAGGFLVRVLINGRKPRALGIFCCMAGVVVTLGAGLVMYQNPLYPFMARHAIVSYGKTFNKDNYKVSEVQVFYSMEDQEYQGRVVMSDGVIYPLYYDRSSGNVYGQEQ